MERTLARVIRFPLTSYGNEEKEEGHEKEEDHEKEEEQEIVSKKSGARGHRFFFVPMGFTQKGTFRFFLKKNVASRRAFGRMRAMEIEFIDLLGTFIAHRTAGADGAAKSACLDWIQKEFLSLSDLDVARGDVDGAPYLLLRHPSPALLWFAHVDVVPGTDEQFSIRRKGENVYGRGVKDMKGAALTFLVAYRDACAEGEPPPVSILLTSDEETGGESPPSLLNEGLIGEVPAAFTPDTGAAPHMVTELKGALWARLIAEGKSGHGAMPWECENPVPLLMHATLSLLERFPAGTADDWTMTVSPTQLVGSDTFNRVPGAAGCTLDVRFPAEQFATAPGALAYLSSFLPPRCRLDMIVTADPLHTDPAHPMVQRVKRIAEAVLGTQVPLGREHGSSDARSFGAHGIPAFLYGPIGGDLHGEAEWASVPSLLQHVEMNKRLLQELSYETFSDQ